MSNLFSIHPHPTYSDYGADESGNVYSLIKGKAKLLKQILRKRSSGLQYRCVCVAYGKKGDRRHKNVAVHRFVWECFNGKIRKNSTKNIDHIDRSPANNSIANLRLVEQVVQLYNQGKRKNCTSKYKGVSLVKKTGNWKAQIKNNGKVYSLGFYKCEEDAARAYDEKAQELWGEWAATNEKLGLLN